MAVLSAGVSSKYSITAPPAKASIGLETRGNNTIVISTKNQQADMCAITAWVCLPDAIMEPIEMDYNKSYIKKALNFLKVKAPWANLDFFNPNAGYLNPLDPRKLDIETRTIVYIHNVKSGKWTPKQGLEFYDKWIGPFLNTQNPLTNSSSKFSGFFVAMAPVLNPRVSPTALTNRQKAIYGFSIRGLNTTRRTKVASDIASLRTGIWGDQWSLDRSAYSTLNSEKSRQRTLRDQSLAQWDTVRKNNNNFS